MSDNSRRVSRRTALKGIAAVASTGVVGSGGIIHATEPAAAINHRITIDDLVVQTTDGVISEIGLGALWFEITYQHIPHDIKARFLFRANGSAGGTGQQALLGLSGDGSETFGYGEQYEDDFEVHLTDLQTHESEPFQTPVNITNESWLEHFTLEDDEDEKTVDVSYQVNLYSKDSADADPQYALSWNYLGFDAFENEVTVERVTPDAELDGDADSFGED